MLHVFPTETTKENSYHIHKIKLRRNFKISLQKKNQQNTKENKNARNEEQKSNKAYRKQIVQ